MWTFLEVIILPTADTSEDLGNVPLATEWATPRVWSALPGYVHHQTEDWEREGCT